MARISVPSNPTDLLNLAVKINEKHISDADKSPLKALEDFDWDKVGVDSSKALALHNQAEELKRQMEKVYRERDMHIAVIKEAVRASRDLLMGVHRSNKKRLGDWGFKVDDSPQTKTPIETKSV